MKHDKNERETLDLTSASAELGRFTSALGHVSDVIIKGEDAKGKTHLVMMRFHDMSWGKAAVLEDEINRTGKVELSAPQGSPDHSYSPYVAKWDMAKSGGVVFDQQDISPGMLKTIAHEIVDLTRSEEKSAAHRESLAQDALAENRIKNQGQRMAQMAHASGYGR